jgi:hypothetical protein
MLFFSRRLSVTDAVQARYDRCEVVFPIILVERSVRNGTVKTDKSGDGGLGLPTLGAIGPAALQDHGQSLGWGIDRSRRKRVKSFASGLIHEIGRGGANQ